MTATPQGFKSWRGIIDAYRDRMPVSDKTPGRHAARRQHAAGRRRRGCPSRPARRCYLKVEGANPTGSFKDRGHDGRDLEGRRGGRQGRRVRVDREHVGVGRGVRDARGHARGGDHSRRSRRAGQARAGAHPRCEGRADPRQLRRRAPRSFVELGERGGVTVVNSINPFRIEGQKSAAFEICDALGDAPDVHCIPVGNAGNITAYWKGYGEYAADAHHDARARACSASRPRDRRRS